MVEPPSVELRDMEVVDLSANSRGLTRLWGLMGRAIRDFALIEDGDRVAVGLSGGKDSLLLTYAMARFRRIAPIRFELSAITIDAGFTGSNPQEDGLAAFCESLGTPHIRHSVPIREAIEAQGGGGSPCSLCSRLRRGALHRVAAENGYGKVALGHHADDAVETLLMNILMAGRVSCFAPRTELTRSGITLVRPMVYVPEGLVQELVTELGLAIVHNPCPANGRTKREEVKQLLADFDAENPGARERALAALSNPGGPWAKASCIPCRTRPDTIVGGAHALPTTEGGGDFECRD